jgi:SHS2 domain-containing protein
VVRPRYEVLDHTADTGVVVYGDTLADLFENVGYAMFDLMFDLRAVPGGRDVPVIAGGDLWEDLLVEWLSELLAQAESRRLAFSGFTVDRIEEGGVQGSASGSPMDGLELRGPPIKAVTYHDLAVVETPDVWWARVIFDV